MRRIAFSLVLAIGLCSCSTISDYWRKPTKYKQLPEHAPRSEDGRWTPPVATLSLDASRRLVISQTRNGAPGSPGAPDSRFTCSEPPPDIALNTLSQTLVSLQRKDGTGAMAGSAYQAISQILSARTSTVEFWRTTSSTYCVLLMNGQTDAAAAYLSAATAAIGRTEDRTVTTPAAAAFIDGLIATAMARAAEEEARRKEALRTELADRKKKCEAVAAADRPNNVDCKRAQEIEKLLAT